MEIVGLCASVKSMPSVSTPDQTDSDSAVIGDDCDTCYDDADNDIDGEGVCDIDDNFTIDSNPDQADFDLDGIGDDCDTCPNDPDNDIDGDGV